jgi:hypothetical protein
MFDTTKDDLKAILRKVDKGELQLPDFQRDYVWGDDDVRSLIASIARGFPVGALLTLESGGEVSFKPRLLEGVAPKDARPAELLLDGQQRITSLYQSTFATAPVKTRTIRGTEVERFYYLDINKALAEHGAFEDAIVGLPADKVLRTNFGKTVVLDLSTREAEFERDLFPLNQVYRWPDWLFAWREHWKARGRDVGDLYIDFHRRVIEPIDDYKMPIIKLDKKNSREAICMVFEKVNVGGKKLDAFELVTAIYAADEFDLREDWNGKIEAGKKPIPGRRARMIGEAQPRDVLRPIASTDFLQACTILHTRAVRQAAAAQGTTGLELPQVSCRRDALLALPLSAYKAYADDLEKGFIEAARFLNELKIIWHKDVPYPPLMVGLACVFAILKPSGLSAAVKEKLEQWLWCITLGELYGSSTETRLARDVPDLVDWIKEQGPRPRSIDEAIFQQERLRTLRSRASAAYKGLHALLMDRGCRDFITGHTTGVMTFFNDQIDIHHIFPQAWCIKQNILPGVFNSIVNKTPLSKLTNIIIGGDAPSLYLKRIEQKHGITPAALDEILRTHLIEPTHLRNDDFRSFFDARMAALATLVSGAMGKAVVLEPGADEQEYEIADPVALGMVDESEEAA